MNENQEQNDSAATNTGEQDLKSMITRMQQQLVFLEKKIDMLIAKSDAKPRAEQSSYKPVARLFGDANRRPDSGYSGGYKDRSSYPGRTYERPRGDEQPRSFGHSSAPERDKGRSFKKPFSGAKRTGFGPQKPFHAKRAGGFHK